METRTLGIEPLGHAPDEFTIGQSGGVLDVVARRGGVAKRNVGRDRAREQDRVLSEVVNQGRGGCKGETDLRYDTDNIPPRTRVELANVYVRRPFRVALASGCKWHTLSVKCDFTTHGVVIPKEERLHRRLPSTALAATPSVGSAITSRHIQTERTRSPRSRQCQARD